MPEATNTERTDLAAMIQAEGEQMIGGANAPGPTRAALVAPTATPAATNAPENKDAGSTPAPKLYLGKFKSEDEATKAHHLLIHSTNALRSQLDTANAELEQARTQLAPGRVDPSQPAQRGSLGPNDDVFRNRYGIEPEDIDARINAGVQSALVEQNRPLLAMQGADAYMAQNYPDFLLESNETKAFVASIPALSARVGALWQNGRYSEAMEIGWLAYDNARRTVNAAAEQNKQTQAQVDASRGDGSALSTGGGGGPREVTPTPGNMPSGNSYPTTPEDWALIREMNAAGREVEVRRILYGHTIAPYADFQRR